MSGLISGTKYAAVDSRGRMSFPAQFLSVLGDILYICPDFDGLGYLSVMSAEGFRAYIDRLKEKYCGANLRTMLRMVNARTETVVPDKMGRITLPPSLCTHANLEGKAAVIGVGDYAEIWNEEEAKKIQEGEPDDDLIALFKEV